jgi:hypothetical protein
MPSMLPVAGRRRGSAAQLQSRGMLLKPQVGGECLLWPARQIMSAISLAALPDRIQSHPPNQGDDIPAPAKICETYACKGLIRNRVAVRARPFASTVARYDWSDSRKPRDRLRTTSVTTSLCGRANGGNR